LLIVERILLIDTVKHDIPGAISLIYINMERKS